MVRWDGRGTAVVFGYPIDFLVSNNVMYTRTEGIGDGNALSLYIIMAAESSLKT